MRHNPITSFTSLLLAGLFTLAIVSCETAEERQRVRKGAGFGAAGGALVGVTLGAIAGEPAAGLAAGAALGGATGAMYEYDQTRDDRRTKMLADSIGGANKGETVDQAGTRHLADFIGDWDVSIWELGPDGKRIPAKGTAKSVMERKDMVRIDFKDIVVEGYDTKVNGYAIMGYNPERGFTFEVKFDVDPQILVWLGEYLPEKNSFNFYFVNDEGDKTSRTGVVRSNVRCELRASGSVVVADTFALIDGKEKQVQSYRLTRK